VYTVRILKAASRELARLDKPIAKRMAGRIRWLAENLDNAKPKAMAYDYYTGGANDERTVAENERAWAGGCERHRPQHDRKIKRKGREEREVFLVSLREAVLRALYGSKIRSHPPSLKMIDMPPRLW